MDSPRGDMQTLPEGIEALRALVLTMMSERDAVVTERDIPLAQNDRLRHLLLQLRRMQFGARSERLPEDQLQLGLEALEQAIAKGDAGLRRDNADRRRASRGALPAHLPRIEVTLAPEDTACPCCRASMTVIGEDTSERLDVIPAQFRVIVTKRPKLACRSCTGTVVQAPASARLIEGGIPTEALVAHVLVARYADHLPLYRQAQIMARQGVILERSTLSFWMGYAAAEVAPVVARLREMMLASTRIFADETVVPVLDPGRGRTKQGYFWAMARDDRPWGGSEPPAVVDHYAPGRGHAHANTLLGGYHGILQCDGYAAYTQFVGPQSNEQSITLVFCWSHICRRFYDLAKTKAPIAMEALRRIAALYEIEQRVRGKSPADRLGVRQAQSKTAGHRTAHLVRGADRETASTRPDRQGDPLCTQSLGGTAAVPRRRTHRTRYQQRRARHAAGGSIERKQPLCGQRRGWRELGMPGVADRDLQAEWGQSTGIFH
jgi:transposase